jgi:hypothetical protein
MPTYTLRPNANWNGTALFNSVGQAFAYQAVSDNSDATYVLRTSTTVPATYEAEFATYTIPSNEKIISVNLRARLAVGTGGSASFNFGVVTDVNARVTSFSIPVTKTNVASVATIDFAYNLTKAPTGEVWTQALLDSLVARFTDDAITGVARTNLYELYIDVLTTTRPTVTVTSPSGSVTDTTFPSILWTYSDTEGDIQNAYEIKIFDSLTYSAAGFNADTSTAIVGSGVVVSPNVGQTLEVDLANSTTYRAYVRVAQLVNGENYFSTWAYSQFSLAIDAPASPTVTAFFDSTVGGVSVTIYGRTNFLTANQATLSTDTTGWQANSNCTISRSATQGLDGFYSLALTTATDGEMTAITTLGTAFTVTQNVSFSAIASFKANALGRACYVGIRWLNAANNQISIVYSSGITDTSAGWTTTSLTATAPILAVKAQLIIKIVSASAGEIHFVDKMALHGGPTPTFTSGGFYDFAFDVERSDNGGTSYTALRESPVAADASQTAQVYDYESPLATTVLYRAKTRASI